MPGGAVGGGGGINSCLNHSNHPILIMLIKNNFCLRDLIKLNNDIVSCLIHSISLICVR